MTNTNNCTASISLATASGVFYNQLLCQLSNLIKTREDALVLLSSLESQLSGTGLVFPANPTAVVDALVAGDCKQAGQLLAAANGNTLIANTDFNVLIN